ncbi:hypothetical protein MBLNU459_g5826t1 [Dothideomycetes sp. NU459]
MSKAKQAAAGASSGQPSSSSTGGGSSWSFAQGFLLGQLILALILFGFIKFFIFGEPPSADSRAATRAALRRQRTLSHSSSLRRRSASDLRSRRRSNAALNGRAAGAASVLTTDKILEKTYYNVDGHQPESLDWFNVLVAQTVAQVRADALDGDAVLGSLTKALNGAHRPDFLDEIKITEISLGEEFPIFSNCRVIPVDEDGAVVKPQGRTKAAAVGEGRLQARMDVDLSDVVTLGIETKLLLNYPKPFSAVLPVALAVSVVRFSGTLSVSFTPSQPPSPPAAPSGPAQPQSASQPAAAPSHSPTTLTFTFLDDYRLDLSVHSLIGSRSRLQDVPKIAQLIEQRIHAWFDERCVEPRFQQIVLPSLWPRKKNVRGGTDEAATDEESSERGDGRTDTPGKKPRTPSHDAPDSREHRTRQSAANRNKPEELMTEQERLAAAGEEIREAEERERERAWERERRSRERQDGDRDRDGIRRRPAPSGLRRETQRDSRA